MSKMNTEKQPRKQTDHRNRRSKGAPSTLGEMQEKIRVLLRRTDPPAAPKKKTQSKYGKATMDKSTSMRSKLQNTPSYNMNTHFTPDTLMSLPPLDYNIVDDMKKTRANINLFKLAKIQSQ